MTAGVALAGDRGYSKCPMRTHRLRPIGGSAAAPPPAHSAPAAGEQTALDAYSAVVTTVAERLTPSVASLAVDRGRRGGGSGSGIVITPDGFVLTSAHVVAGADGGRAAFVDGAELPFRVVGRDPLSDLAVVRTAASDL